MKSRSDGVGAAGDTVDHGSSGDAERQRGAATEQSTHSAAGGAGSEELLKCMRRSLRQNPAGGHALILLEKHITAKVISTNSTSFYTQTTKHTVCFTVKRGRWFCGMEKPQDPFPWRCIANQIKSTSTFLCIMGCLNTIAISLCWPHWSSAVHVDASSIPMGFLKLCKMLFLFAPQLPPARIHLPCLASSN